MYLHTHPILETHLLLDKCHVIVDRDDWEKAAAPVYLSHRNLLTLLHKLMQPRNRRMLVKPSGRVIVAETDETCYHDRSAGPVSPETEAFIRTVSPRLDALASDDQTPPKWAIKAAQRIATAQMECRITTCECHIVRRYANIIVEEARGQPDLRKLTPD